MMAIRMRMVQLRVDDVGIQQVWFAFQWWYSLELQVFQKEILIRETIVVTFKCMLLCKIGWIV